MKITSEQMLDMLPHIADLYDKLDMDGYRKSIKKKESVEQVGIDAFKYILKNAPKVKNEIHSVVAIAQGISLEEAKAQPFTETLSALSAIFTDKELLSFFKSAM